MQILDLVLLLGGTHFSLFPHLSVLQIRQFPLMSLPTHQLIRWPWSAEPHGEVAVSDI